MSTQCKQYSAECKARVAREAPAGTEARIRYLYTLALGRPPVKTELELGTKLVVEATGPDPWERYCLLILCTNEFLYVE